jgi:hypothetical protein
VHVCTRVCATRASSGLNDSPVNAIDVGPVSLYRDKGEALLLDQPLCDLSSVCASHVAHMPRVNLMGTTALQRAHSERAGR